MEPNNFAFRAFFEHSASGMLVIDSNENIIDANNAACHFLGKSHQRLCSLTYSFISPEDSLGFAALVKLTASEKQYHLITCFNTDTKEVIKCEMNAFLTGDVEQSGWQLCLVFNPVTKAPEAANGEAPAYRQMVQMAKEGIWVYDENHITTFASHALCQMLGYESYEMVGRDIFYFVDESRTQRVKDNLNRRKSGISEQFDFPLLSKNGEQIWTIVNTSPLFKGGIYAGAVAVITDITARKKAEDDVSNSEDRFRVMVENSYDAILLLDENLRTVYRSPSTTHIMGFKDDERLGQSYLELTHPDDVEKLKGLQQTVINHPGRSIPITVRARHSDGHYLWFIGVATNLLHEKNVQAIVVNLRDISERKKVEDDLKRLSNRLQLATQAANVCIADWDIDKNHVTFDDCMFALYQIDPSEFNNRFDAWAQRVHPDDRGRVTQDIETALTNKNDFKLQFRIVLPYGEIRHIISMCIVERDASGRAIRIVATNRDATAQVKDEKEREKLIGELIERNKALEQFAYIVSHNLRAPVANLVGLTEMITDTDLDDTDRAEIIGGLNKSVIKIDHVITDLNEIFQSRQHLYDHKEVVELQTLINDIRFSINDLMLREKVILNSKFSESCKLYTTRLYLYSILYNIILNAIKYRKPDVTPMIEVKGTYQDSWLHITIADNGRGIDLQRHGDSLFGLYKRFDHTVEGRGLGLYMVKTQIDALGGHIKVDSELGRGTKFSIFIPIKE